MNLAFGRLKRREAAEVATRAFDDYEYFTNWFPEKQSRNRIQFALLWEAEVRSVIAAAQEAPSWANTQTSRYYVALSEEKADAVRGASLRFSA